MRVRPTHRADPCFALTDCSVDQSIFKDRRVEITGRFKYEDEIVLGPKSLDGQPGYQVITPFVLSDGRSAEILCCAIFGSSPHLGNELF
jgi:cytochrome oxidase assembly protein ShyY1